MGEIARARYRYVGAQPGDLSFEADDIIKIIDKPETGWWVGQLDDGRKGEFPYNFVEIISEEEKSAIVNTRRITTEGRYNRGKSDVHRIKEINLQVKGDKFSVIAHVIGGPNIVGKREMSEFRKLDHVCHELIDQFDSILPPAWADNVGLTDDLKEERVRVLKKYLNKLIGVEIIEYAIIKWLDPSAKFKARSDIKAEYNNKSQRRNGVYRNDPENFVKNAPPLAKVLFAWDPQDHVELAISAGETIAILNRNTQSEGWWEGETVNGDRGLLPYNYVQLLSPNEARALVLGEAVNTTDSTGNALRALSPRQAVKKKQTPRPQQQNQYHGQQQGMGRQQKKEAQFCIKTPESFDKLLHAGYTVEQNDKLIRIDESKPKPTSGDRCEVTYHAFVWNCQTQEIVEVASSDIPNDEGKTGPLVFSVDKGQVVKGLEEGIKRVERGQAARIIITPRLAYGDVGNPRERIPPNAFLIYDITLQSFGNGGGVGGGFKAGHKGQAMKKKPGSPRGKRPPGGPRSPRQNNTPRNPQFPPGSPRTQMMAEAVAEKTGKQQQPNYNGPIKERPRRRLRQKRERYKAPVEEDPNQVKIYRLQQLQEIVMKSDFKRAQVNPNNIEDHLDGRDFEKTFGMQRDNFILLPKWQQGNMLKRAKILPRF